MLCLGTKYLFHSMTHRWVCFLKCVFSGCIHKTGCTVTSGFWVELGDLKEIKPEDILIQMSSDILGILVLTLCKYTGFKVKCQLRCVSLAGMRQRDPHLYLWPSDVRILLHFSSQTEVKIQKKLVWLLSLKTQKEIQHSRFYMCLSVTCWLLQWV